MTFEIPAEEGSTSRLKEITVTKGNKSIIFNDTTEIDIPSVALNIALNTESITVGSDTLKVMTTNTDQTIGGTKTFDSHPIIHGISNSDQTDSIAWFTYSSGEGSSVVSTGHFVAYGDDDSSNTLKPTTEYAEAQGGDVDAYYFSTGIALFEANGQVESVKLSYPAKSGTFALTNDIPTVSLTTTTGSESITVNSDSLNVATINTNQTISSNKTIAYGNKTNYALNNGNVYDLSGNQYNYLQIGYNGIGMYSFGNSQFFPNSNNSRDLGTQELSWRNLYLAQNLSDGTNSITVAEIAAKQDAVKVKRYI